MIKHINHQNISTTPFNAVKAWELFNIENDVGILLEPLSGSSPIPDTLVSIDYVDYTSGNPLLNTACNVAIEQQPEDEVIYEEGISGSGRFNPYTEAQNSSTNTYKRLVYAQISRAFYNTYRNPLEIFGMENVDFPLSRTIRFLTDEFRVFTIPRIKFGDKIVEGSVRFYDTSFDDNIDIYDDSYGNLIAGNHIFSKIQEIRTGMGNRILSGSVNNTCSVYHEFPPSGAIVLVVYSGSAILLWTYTQTDHNGFYTQKSLDGTNFTPLSTVPSPVVYTYPDPDVSVGNTYWYRVCAYNSKGSSSWSNICEIYFPPSLLYTCKSSSFPPELFTSSLSGPPIPPVPGGGYKICDWPTISSSLTALVCDPSVLPEWDGVFTNMTQSITLGYDIWYFTGSAIGGQKVAADEGANWPSGNWTDNGYTQIYWEATTPAWYLMLTCLAGGTWWIGQGPDTPLTPSGSYTFVFGTPNVLTMSVLSENEICPPTCSCEAALATPNVAYTTSPYSHSIIPGFGTGPYTFSAVQLPSGFIIDSSGLVTGNPSIPENVWSTITMIDSLGSCSKCSVNFNVQNCSICCESSSIDVDGNGLVWQRSDQVYSSGGTISGDMVGGTGSLSLTTVAGFIQSGRGVTFNAFFCTEVPTTVQVTASYTAFGTHVHEWGLTSWCEIGPPMFAEGVPQDTAGPANYSGTAMGAVALGAGNHLLHIGMYVVNNDPAGNASNLNVNIESKFVP